MSAPTTNQNPWADENGWTAFAVLVPMIGTPILIWGPTCGYSTAEFLSAIPIKYTHWRINGPQPCPPKEKTAYEVMREQYENFSKIHHQHQIDMTQARHERNEARAEASRLHQAIVLGRKAMLRTNWAQSEDAKDYQRLWAIALEKPPAWYNPLPKTT